MAVDISNIPEMEQQALYVLTKPLFEEKGDIAAPIRLVKMQAEELHSEFLQAMDNVAKHWRQRLDALPDRVGLLRKENPKKAQEKKRLEDFLASKERMSESGRLNSGVQEYNARLILQDTVKHHASFVTITPAGQVRVSAALPEITRSLGDYDTMAGQGDPNLNNQRTKTVMLDRYHVELLEAIHEKWEGNAEAEDAGKRLLNENRLVSSLTMEGRSRGHMRLFEPPSIEAEKAERRFAAETAVLDQIRLNQGHQAQLKEAFTNMLNTRQDEARFEETTQEMLDTVRQIVADYLMANRVQTVNNPGTSPRGRE